MSLNGEFRNNYGYVNEIDHYDSTFIVEYKNGKVGTITCRRHDMIYDKLMNKVPMGFAG